MRNPSAGSGAARSSTDPLRGSTDPAQFSSGRDKYSSLTGSVAAGSGGFTTRSLTGGTSSRSTTVLKEAPKQSVIVRCSRFVVEHKFVVAFTTLLTVWVLVSEDLKLIMTDKPADTLFGILGVCCITVFSLEILLSSVGKEDYFLGFFFLLDVISTASLFLDLPWVMEGMEKSDEEENGSMVDAERGRTARIGARSARVVRVIRLVRIAKLYKAIYEVSGRGRLASYKGRLHDDDDDDNPSKGSESRVGKKLSDITTRRVIILVLSMLIILPYLSPDESFKMPSSGNYGADEVWLAFRKVLNTTGTDAAATAARATYEAALLRYLFYHNWFSGKLGCDQEDAKLCPNRFDSHLFWVGIVGKESEQVKQAAAQARLRQQGVEQWAEEVKRQRAMYVYGNMPDAALEILWSEWYDCKVRNSNMHRLGISLLQKKMEGLIEYVAPCYDDLRTVERVSFSPWAASAEEHGQFRFTFWFDQRKFTQMESKFSIATTAFICFVLCGSAMSFYNDVNQLVLYPVEEMISKVIAIRKDPLMAVKMSEQMLNKEVKRFTSKTGETCDVNAKWNRIWLEERMIKAKRILACTSTQQEEPMETVILEKTIVKLGSLLALGFGEAGAQIIAANMVGNSSGVNVMLPGRLVDCIIGHARILNFSVATQVLQSRVMTFVNQVAEIVHGVVEEHLGSANRNNGDTFLLIWRISEHEQNGISATTIADMSLLTFAKIIGAVHRSSTLAQYRGHPGLQNKLGSRYRVHLTCGLHCGWAIEGAVGSEYKIEASYLSPNVSVAVNIEDATSVYGVSFLASEAVVTLAHDEMRRKCRVIDCVLIPGSSVPLELYSLDLDEGAVPVDETPSSTAPFGAKLRMRARQFLEAEKAVKPTQNIRALFDNDRVILSMRRGITVEFLETFRMGYQNYAEGEWQVARRFLEEAASMRGSSLFGSGDGPCNALVRFMETYQFEAPDGWKGIHDLHDQGRQGQGQPRSFKLSV